MWVYLVLWQVCFIYNILYINFQFDLYKTKRAVIETALLLGLGLWLTPIEVDFVADNRAAPNDVVFVGVLGIQSFTRAFGDGGNLHECAEVVAIVLAPYHEVVCIAAALKSPTRGDVSDHFVTLDVLADSHIVVVRCYALALEF